MAAFVSLESNAPRQDRVDAGHPAWAVCLRFSSERTCFMWIFTQHGYVSVVQHFTPTPGAELLVRARARRHLERVLGLVLPSDQVRDLVRST
ncbi:MAG: hypothetical protein CMJ67_01740, partial [Planctomycetaceae bacterium]|nr:hypothetical protein [Planctomycetaceae bacterium]